MSIGLIVFNRHLLKKAKYCLGVYPIALPSKLCNLFNYIICTESATDWQLILGFKTQTRLAEILLIDVINNKARSFGSMQIPSDGILMGSNTLAGDLGGITILTPWSNGNGCDLEGRFFYINFIWHQNIKMKMKTLLRLCWGFRWDSSSEILHKLLNRRNSSSLKTMTCKKS